MHGIDERHKIVRRAPFAALGLLAALALAGCGGGAGGEQAEEGAEVNPVEAMLAIDDVRVAGVPLASVPPQDSMAAALTRGAAERQADGLLGTGEAAAEDGTATVSTAPPGDDAAVPGTAAADPAAGQPPAQARPAARQAPRPLAHLAVGDPLVVDMEVADAPAGSQVTVVWFGADGRPVWRQRREVGEGPRLAFSADTARWRPGVYRGEIRYGEQTLHRFAVQVGTVAAPAIADERGTALPDRPSAAGTVASTARPLTPPGETREPAPPAPSEPAQAAPAPPGRPTPAAPEPRPDEPTDEPVERPAPQPPPDEPALPPPPVEPPPQPPPDEDEPPRRRGR